MPNPKDIATSQMLPGTMAMFVFLMLVTMAPAMLTCKASLDLGPEECLFVLFVTEGYYDKFNVSFLKCLNPSSLY